MVFSTETGTLGVLELEKCLVECSTIDQLRQLACQIKQRRTEIDHNIKEFTANKSLAHQSAVRGLELKRVELATTLNHSRNLKSIMEDANVLGFNVTNKVRSLDDEKFKIKTLKDYVDNVETLKNEMKRANEAIIAHDLYNAAKSISLIRQLPEEIIKDPYVDYKVPTSELDDAPYKFINKWIEDLELTFIEGFERSASQKSVKELTFYFQLFPLIGKASKGLSCYSKFICDIISESSRNLLKSVKNNDSQTEVYSHILFKLYQTISNIVIQHSKVIKSYYGDDVLSNILSDIQVECDFQSNLIYDTYSDAKDLKSLESKIQKYDYPILIKEITQQQKAMTESESESEDELQDPQGASIAEICKATDELSAMMNHWAMYSKFFTVLWNDNIKIQKEIYPPPLIISTFAYKIKQSAVTTFDSFCTYTVRRTLEKACTIESLGEMLPSLTKSVTFLTTIFKNMNVNSDIHSLMSDDSPISSLADDLIIVLNTIIMEILATGELFSIKNMISNIKRILLVDFSSIIQQRLNKLILNTSSNLLTKPILQKIHNEINPEFYQSPRAQSPALGGPSSKVGVGASELANTGAMFMKSLNAAINYTMTGEDETELINSGHGSDIQKYIIYLNTLSTFSMYLEKLVERCGSSAATNSLLLLDDKDIKSVQTALQGNSQTEIVLEIDLHDSEGKMTNKVSSLLGTLSTGFKERSDAIITGRLNVLFDKVLKLKIIKLVRDSLAVSYLHLNEEYGEVGNKLSTFVKNWNSLVIPYATTLAKPIFLRLSALIIYTAVIALEDKIWGYEKKISPSGAIQLEHDISFVIGELTKFNYSLREHFIKVTQLVMVLGLEDDDEIIELESGGIEWALTPSEISNCRKLLIS